MATITKRGTGQWQVKVRRKGWPVQSSTFNTKGDAEAWAREIENEMDRGVFISRKEAESTILREALERFRKEKIPTYAHPKKEENRLDHLLQYSLVDMHLGAIRGKHIAEFIELRIDEGVGGNTIRLDLAMLSKLFSMAVQLLGSTLPFPQEGDELLLLFDQGIDLGGFVVEEVGDINCLLRRRLNEG
ncbi:site-specific integrase [Desulfoplanes sp.]